MIFRSKRTAREHSSSREDIPLHEIVISLFLGFSFSFSYSTFSFFLFILYLTRCRRFSFRLLSFSSQSLNWRQRTEYIYIHAISSPSPRPIARYNSQIILYCKLQDIQTFSFGKNMCPLSKDTMFPEASSRGCG